MRRTLLAISAAAALLAGACGSSDHGATAHNVVSSTSVATLAPATTTTTSVPASTTTRAPTTTLPNTAVVPDKITVPYVDAVLAKLNHIYGNAVRLTVAAKKLTPGAIRDLDAIYSSKLASEERSIFQEAASAGFRGIRKDPGDRKARVVKVISESPNCVFATVRTSYSAVDLRATKAPAIEWIGIDRRGTGVGINPTPWVFFFDGISASATKIANQCDASS